MFKLLLVTFATLIATYDACILYDISENGVSDSDQQIIVKKHNELRQKILNGEVAGQPKGVNLKTLTWNAELAQNAQGAASACSYPSDISDVRMDVGQNLAVVIGDLPLPLADWNTTIQKWFDENELFTYPTLSSNTRHYTQIVWADTEYIGCSYSAYTETTINQYRAFYVCLYAPAGNIPDSAPYEIA